MNPLPISLLAAAPKEVITDSRYYWDSRRRGKNRFCIFQYTWSGAGVFRDLNGEASVPAGHALFTTTVEPSAYYYSPQAREPWVFGWVDIAGALDLWTWLRQEFGSIIALNPSGAAITTFREIAVHYAEGTFQDRFQSSELVFRFLMEVLRELTSSSSRQKDSAIHYARHYLDDHHRRPLSIKELAAKVGMSREHFSRCFADTMGQSPGTYLRERRLQTAELLLRQSSETVNVISRLSGFTSSSHFCRAFRARRGCTPEGFRKRK